MKYIRITDEKNKEYMIPMSTGVYFKRHPQKDTLMVMGAGYLFDKDDMTYDVFLANFAEFCSKDYSILDFVNKEEDVEDNTKPPKQTRKRSK